jgi:hypothetical protein
VLLPEAMATTWCADLRVGAKLHSWSGCSVRRSQMRRAHIGKRQLWRATDAQAEGTTTLQPMLPMCIIGRSALLSQLVEWSTCNSINGQCA